MRYAAGVTDVIWVSKPGSAMELQPELLIGRYRATFAAERGVRSLEFAGNVWRGALGHALQQGVCVTGLAECRHCPLYRSCLFPYFWDTPPPQNTQKMRKYETAPHPFVLDPDPTDALRLEFALCGRANQHLPIFVHALQKAAAGPRGIGGNVLALRQLEQAVPEAGSAAVDWRVIQSSGGRLTALPVLPAMIPAVPTALAIDVVTPMRVKHEGRLVGAEAFAFSDLFSNLLRRISMLSYFHSDTPLETDFRGLTEAARSVRMQKQLRWQEQSRYSNRQQAGMKMGGVIGTMTISGQPLAAFWPYLWLGQWLHAGSAATMGMGRYRLTGDAATSLSNGHGGVA